MPAAMPAAEATERQLFETIAAGELDEHLVAIADAVDAR
jgi:hypothetical protein